MLAQNPLISDYLLATCDSCVNPIFSASAELTSECTDKCVVVQCNGGEHGGERCQGDIRCESACDGVEDCTSCSGLDDFLFSHNYHPTFHDPPIYDTVTREPQSNHPLDRFLCGSEPPNPDSTASSSETCPPMTQNASHHVDPVPAISTSAFPGIALPPTYSVPATPYGEGHSPSSRLLPCLWANCQASFASLPELVGHVNLEHLRLPSEPSVAALPPRDSSDTILQSLSCRWGNCDRYPSAEFIPSSSSCDSVDVMRNVIAQHLLYDHLASRSPRHVVGDVLPRVFEPIPSSVAPGTESSARSPVQETSQSTVTEPPVFPTLKRANISPISSSGTIDVIYKCLWQSCDTAFISLDGLTVHVTHIHVGRGKAHYDCFWEGCQRNGLNGFSSKQKICRHIQSHTGHRPHQCDVCFQYFSEAATLQQHMRRHTQERPYVCDYPGCGKSFAITGALTIHKRIHNGLKPFKCKYCEKAFAESSNLSKHLRTHTGVRPYTCIVAGCNRSFARPDQLSRHQAVHRKKQPSVPKATVVAIAS